MQDTFNYFKLREASIAMNNQLKTTIKKVSSKLLILSLLSGAIVSTLPTKTIAETPTPETFSQECAAADWPNLKAQIETRYNDVQISLNQILDEVKNTTIPPDQVNSEKQIESIDALLSCLKTSSASSQEFEKSINLLTDFKTKFLEPIKPGLVGDNFSTLKKNLGLQESDTVVIPKFEETFNQFKTDLGAEIQNLLTTSPDIDPSRPPHPTPPDPEITPKKQEDSDSFRLRPWQTLLVIILGLICLFGVIFLITSDRSNHSHRRSRRSSKLLSTLQTEYHLPLLSSKGKWKPEAAQDLPGEEMDERSEIGYLKQKIDNLERQMEKTNRSIALIQDHLKEITLGQKSIPSQQTTTHSVASWQSNAPNTLSTQPYDKPQAESLFVNSVSPDPLVSMSPIDQLIQTYNTSPVNLQGVGVSETQESFNQRRSGLNVPVTVTQASNPSLYIVQDSYLVPRPGSKVTSHMLNTIEAVFDCYNFRSGAPFQLIEPAIVSPLSNNQWQLNQRGKLKFL